MIEIKIEGGHTSIKLLGAPATILSEFTAAIDNVSKTIVGKATESLSKKVRLMIKSTVSGMLSNAAVSLLTDEETAPVSSISVDTNDLDELKKQIREMENGNGE